MIHLAFALLIAQDVPKDQASVEGIVLNALTNEPLRKAEITFAGKKSYAAISGQDGKFHFAINPGTYNVTVHRNGFLDSADEPPIQVASGQEVKGIVFKLMPEGVIAGRVLDEDGDPVPGANVVVERAVTVGGRRIVLANQQSESNSEGSFFVSDLRAGRYDLTANPQPKNGIVVDVGINEALIPNANPVAVHLNAGSAVRDVEIRVAKSRTFRVRGRIAGVVGNPPGLNLVEDRGYHSYGVFQRNGEFTVFNVPPGNYSIINSEISIDHSTGTAARPQLHCRTPVTVTDHDVDGITVEFRPGASVEGAVRFEGDGKFEKLPTFRLDQGIWNPEVTAKDDGTFGWTNLSFEKHPLDFSPPDGFYVKSTQFNHQPVNGSMLDLRSGGGSLEIVMARNPALLSATVRDENGGPLPNIKVTLWSGSIQRTFPTDTTGVAHFAALPPGEYRIAAWQSLDSELYTIPEFLDLFDAQKVTLKEGPQAIDVKLTPKSVTDAEIAKLQ